MERFIGFFRKERLYILILIFVLIFNFIVISNASNKDKAKKQTQTQSNAFAEEAAKKEKISAAISGNENLFLLFGIVSFLALAIILFGIVIDIIILPLILSKKLDIRSLSPPKAKWNMWDVCKVAILFLFFGYIIIISEAFLSIVFPVFKNDNFRMIINSSILDILTVVFIIYFSVKQYREPLISLGISTKNFLKNVFYGLLGYAAIVPVLVLMLLAITIITTLARYVPARQPVVELFLKEKDTVFLTYSSLFAAIVGPIIEELFFRGFLYGALKKYVGIFWSAIGTAALFAVLHVHLVGFLPIMALGIFLAYIYEKTGTLVSSITVHMVHNLSMVFLVFLIKQVGVV